MCVPNEWEQAGYDRAGLLAANSEPSSRAASTCLDLMLGFGGDYECSCCSCHQSGMSSLSTKAHLDGWNEF
jgi:hypothetical protein